jgi:hypothetical protein
VGPTSGIPRLNSFFCRIDTTSNANAFPLSGFFAVACGGAEAPACADAIGTPNAMQTITAAKLKLCASRIMVSTILFSKFWHDLMFFHPRLPRSRKNPSNFPANPHCQVLKLAPKRESPITTHRFARKIDC